MTANVPESSPREANQGRLRTADNAAVTTASSIGVAFIAGAAVTLLFEDVDRELAVSLVFLGVLAWLSAGAIWLFNRSYHKALRRIEAGKYYLHWRYDDATWQLYCRKYARRQSKMFWAIILALLVTGIFASVLAHKDGNLVSDSLFWTYLVYCGGATVTGVAIGLIVRWTTEARARLMKNLPGEAYIGHDGLYITGQFWPWGSMGWKLKDIAIADSEPSEICFHFRSSGGHKIICAPVPRGEHITVERLRNLVNTQDNRDQG